MLKIVSAPYGLVSFSLSLSPGDEEKTVKRQIVGMAAIIAVLLLLAGCGGGGEEDTPANRSPSADAGPDQTVDAGNTVTLDGSGSDTDGSIARYQWTQTVGPTVSLANASQASTSFTAPESDAAATLTFRLTVTDDDGATASDEVSVTVQPRAPVNQPPSANAGPDQTVDAGSTVTLTGSGSDADGSIVRYQWTQTAEVTVSLSTANQASASFVAPAGDASVTLMFRLTVTDDDGATASDEVSVTVQPRVPANQSPRANAGPDQTVDAGSMVTLAGSGSDSDGEITSYQWAQTGGPTVSLSVTDQALSSFVAPEGDAAVMLTFRLTATDDDGATASDEVSVTVQPQAPANQPPSANAGPDQTVEAGSTLTLAGSGSDADGSIARYQWTQMAGTTVSLLNADQASASFVAPTGNASVTLTFRLTVTDDDGATASDEVSVTVQPQAPANQPPSANAGPDQTVDMDSVVMLFGSGTDPDGEIASYQWAQTGGPTVSLSVTDQALSSFVAPQGDSTVMLTFRFTVTDDEGATASDSVTVTLRAPEPFMLGTSKLDDPNFRLQ